MTTMNDTALRKITALRDRALHANTPAPEAETAMTLARKLCAKHGIDVAILDVKPETKSVRDDVINGQAQPQRKYSCRFGCSTWTMHTIDELNECAAKARARSATGSAYDAPKTKARDPWDDVRDFFNQQEARSRRTHADDSATYTDSRGRTKTHQARSSGSHAYCSHEATKAARAKCRRERGY